MRFRHRMRECSERQTQYKTLMRASVIFFCLAKIFLLYKYYMLVLPLQNHLVYYAVALIFSCLRFRLEYRKWYLKHALHVFRSL